MLKICKVEFFHVGGKSTATEMFPGIFHTYIKCDCILFLRVFLWKMVYALLILVAVEMRRE